MAYLIFFLVVGYPVAEIASIFWLADAIGSLWAWFWIGCAFLIGSLMLQNHKLALMATLMGDLRAGKLNAGSLFTIARYYIAAVLFIIPGPISDVMALLLLLPWRRKPAPAAAVDDGIIEGDYRRVEPNRDDKLIR